MKSRPQQQHSSPYRQAPRTRRLWHDGRGTTTPGGKAAGDGNYTIAVVPKDTQSVVCPAKRAHASDTGMNVPSRSGPR